jgi:CheY-like chemotaxis protein
MTDDTFSLRASLTAGPSDAADGKPGGGTSRADGPNLFSRALVHDLRNAAAPIRNAVQLLRLRANGNPDLGKVADIIDRQVNEIVRLLNVPDDARDSSRSLAEGGARATPAGAVVVRRKILVVDDNAAFLTSLCSVLSEAGHNVKTAPDGIEALALAQSWEPEFVLLDVHMPHMNGFEVAKRLRTLFSPEVMKIVLLSGSTLDDATLRGAERAGFDHCMDKIQDFAALEALLRGNA